MAQQKTGCSFVEISGPSKRIHRIIAAVNMGSHSNCMKKRSTVVLCGVLVALVTGLLWLVLYSRGPVYEGKPLDAWLREFDKRGGTAQTTEKAREAIRHMGTDALPELLAMLRSEDSNFQVKLRAIIGGQGLIAFHMTSEAQRHRLAFFALDALGSNAAPAVPELVALLHSTNADIRDLTAQALGSIGTPERMVVSALTNAPNDPDLRVRRSIAESLGRVRKQPELAVPALVAQLGATDYEERQMVMISLSRFGRDARQAVPALLLQLQDSDARIRKLATDVLALIQPEAMATTKSP